jgi:dTDP-D-glucose 4,6-dehydratase
MPRRLSATYETQAWNPVRSYIQMKDPDRGFYFTIQNQVSGLEFVVQSWNEQSNKQIIVKFKRLLLTASKHLNQ